jgi:hypothetical protein
MTLRFASLAVVVGCALAPRLSAQSPLPSALVGIWRGTSICLVHPSSCHDETVVYQMTRTATRDSVTLDARKIVDGAEVEMGVLGCKLDAADAQVNCVMPNGVWRFTIRGDSLLGKLRLPDGTVFREVRAVRPH